ncbi:HAD family hydrolase [Cupriavidus taiwanensis]|uniref:HAD family hydrolase n=1 Tax=Cupriavidus taiwanensis TaxID=164546 RepID=UPI000E2F486E|nr:HAD family hydrolase [Cupriavidus taiwanensis]
MSAIPSEPIQAVIFDAFDTLCEIGSPLHPFAEIARAGGKRTDARVALMTQPVDIRQAVEQFQLTEVDIDIVALEQRLEIELASIRLFDDTIPTLLELRRRGIRLAIASNLAAPYAPPLLRLLPIELDAYAWSFDVGYLKPQAEIFEWTTAKLRVPAAATLMVGDTYKAGLHWRCERRLASSTSDSLGEAAIRCGNHPLTGRDSRPYPGGIRNSRRNFGRGHRLTKGRKHKAA